MELIDTHCHLTFEPLADDIEGVLERGKSEGVIAWITVGTDPQHNRRAVELAGRFDHMYAAVELEGAQAAKPPMVVALAKREELIYVQARHKPLKLARNNEALRLLQSIRDESHRFGQHYHHLLRRKKAFDQDVQQGRKPPRKQ